MRMSRKMILTFGPRWRVCGVVRVVHGRPRHAVRGWAHVGPGGPPESWGRWGWDPPVVRPRRRVPPPAQWSPPSWFWRAPNPDGGMALHSFAPELALSLNVTHSQSCEIFFFLKIYKSLKLNHTVYYFSLSGLCTCSLFTPRVMMMKIMMLGLMQNRASNYFRYDDDHRISLSIVSMFMDQKHIHTCTVTRFISI